MTRRALVRQVSASFASALRRDSAGRAPDLGRAREQHRAYCQALEGLGLAVQVLPPHDDHPDACFVEDRLVAAWGRGLVTRSLAPTRCGAAPSLAAATRDHLDLTVMTTGGLDGGDVIRLGDTLLVGLSDRTDTAGVRALERWVSTLGVSVVPIALREGLHLKCEATPLGDDTLLCAENWPYREAVPLGVRVVTVPEGEAYAANAVAHGAEVLMAEGYPGAAAAVAASGRRVTTVDVSQFRRADGSLTCLSVLLP